MPASIAVWVKWFAGYGLKKIPGTAQVSPSPSSTWDRSASPRRNASKKPNRPSRTVGGPVKPRCDQRRGGDGRVRGPAAVQPLDRAAGAVRLDDAGREGGGDARARAARPPRRGPSASPRRRRRPSRRRSRWRAGRARRTPSCRARCRSRPCRGVPRSPGRPRSRATVAAPSAPARLGGGERGRDDRGARVQHRGQVGVVVVERVGEHPVGERRLGGGQRVSAPRRAVASGAPALLGDVADGGGAGRQPVGGDAQAEHVEDPLPRRCGHVRPGSGPGRGPGREPGELGRRGSSQPRPTTASGRTGDPVAPKMGSGESTKVNSCTPSAASSSRSSVSMM